VKVGGSFQFPSSIRPITHYELSAGNGAKFVWIALNGVNFSILPELVLNLSFTSHVKYLYVPISYWENEQLSNRRFKK
jgi:hypothetical protein